MDRRGALFVRLVENEGNKRKSLANLVKTRLHLLLHNVCRKSCARSWWLLLSFGVDLSTRDHTLKEFNSTQTQTKSIKCPCSCARHRQKTTCTLCGIARAKYCSFRYMFSMALQKANLWNILPSQRIICALVMHKKLVTVITNTDSCHRLMLLSHSFQHIWKSHFWVEQCCWADRLHFSWLLSWTQL